VKVAGPAVVTVLNHLAPTSGSGTGTGRFGGVPQQQEAEEASGSGVIIDKNGDIVTNDHVVEGEQSLEVIFYNTTDPVSATLVGTDAYSDLAVIHVNAAVPGVASFGNSDSLEVGQPVVAIGSPLGEFQNTVTEGIVSALHRSIDDTETGGTASTSLQNLIQTDAAINHGNSGGPLLDLNGNVVGINVAVVRGDGTVGSDVAEGLGFAIPSNLAKQITQQLITSGSIQRPYIGITYESLDAAAAAQLGINQTTGVYVSEVASGSPAEKAGIKANSIITKIDGTTIDQTKTLVDLLSNHKPGDTITLSVIDPGASTEHNVTLTLGVRPAGE
jgi:2-alkenal reductase